MKKGWGAGKWWLLCSVCWYLASIAMFLGNEDKSMAVVYLCLGSTFLCLSIIGNKKNDEENNESGEEDSDKEADGISDDKKQQ